MDEKVADRILSLWDDWKEDAAKPENERVWKTEADFYRYVGIEANVVSSSKEFIEKDSLDSDIDYDYPDPEEFQALEVVREKIWGEIQEESKTD